MRAARRAARMPAASPEGPRTTRGLLAGDPLVERELARQVADAPWTPGPRGAGRGRTPDTEPEVGRMKSSRVRIVVVLPAPFGPRNPNASPAWTGEGEFADPLHGSSRRTSVRRSATMTSTTLIPLRCRPDAGARTSTPPRLGARPQRCCPPWMRPSSGSRPRGSGCGVDAAEPGLPFSRKPIESAYMLATECSNAFATKAAIGGTIAITLSITERPPVAIQTARQTVRWPTPHARTPWRTQARLADRAR